MQLKPVITVFLTFCAVQSAHAATCADNLSTDANKTEWQDLVICLRSIAQENVKLKDELAAIELKPGPSGQDGADGKNGLDGKDGAKGPTGEIERLEYNVSRNQRGTTLTIPEADVARLCGDSDGCSVRIGMINHDSTGRIASRQFTFFYNASSGNWRSSLGDASGSNGDNIVQHPNHSWACYFTDGKYSGFSDQGDPDRNFGLLSWNQFNADCRLVLID